MSADQLQIHLSRDRSRMKVWREGERVAPADADVLRLALYVAGVEKLDMVGIRRRGDHRTVEVLYRQR